MHDVCYIVNKCYLAGHMICYEVDMYICFLQVMHVCSGLLVYTAVYTGPSNMTERHDPLELLALIFYNLHTGISVKHPLPIILSRFNSLQAPTNRGIALQYGIDFTIALLWLSLQPTGLVS